MKDIEQRAFLLHSRPYRENQLLVDLLTENDGKIGAVIYSGKTAKSNKKSILQPFSPLLIAYKGKSNLKSLTMVESAGKSLLLTGRFLFSAFYVNELLVRLLPELISCEPLYKQYVMTLRALEAKEFIEPSLRKFELALLEELGIALDFEPAGHSDYRYLSFCTESGFVPSDSAIGNYDKHHIQAIAQNNFHTPEVLLTFKRLMREIIDHLLGHKPLHSRKFFMK